MHRRTLVGLPLLPALATGGAWAEPATVAPIVLELFTSQSCSSCPPADALLTDLGRRPDVLALSLHVTYWDRLGWRDRFSLREATERQRRYARLFGGDSIYTPQLVVQGRRHVVGSDRRAVLAAIAAAEPTTVPLTLTRQAERLRLTVGAGTGAATLVLLGFDTRHVTPIGGGENGGRTLTQTQVVRAVGRVGEWTGAPLTLELPRPEGERAAVLLQGDDGRMLGAVALLG